MSTHVAPIQPEIVHSVKPSTQEEAQQQWLDERTTFIGGSEAHELLNQAQYGKGCIRALAYRKTKAVPDYPEQLPDAALLERGKILEPLVASMYEEQTGRKVRRPAMNEWGLPRVQRNPDYPGAGVHTDRFILAGAAGITETGDLEIKTHAEGPYLHIMRDGLPPAHALQPQWSNFVTTHKWWSFGILGVFGALPMKHFDGQRDEELMDIFKRSHDYFWNALEKGQLPPPPIAADDQRCKVCAFRMTCRGEEIDRAEAAMIAAEKSGKQPLVQITNPKLSQALADRASLKQEVSALEETLDLVEGTVKAELGDTDAALVQGFGKVYHKLQSGRTTAELGKIMEYLKDVANPANDIAVELEAMAERLKLEEVDKIILGQTAILLRNLHDVPETVSKKYMKVGASFRALRVYPIN